MHLKKNLSQQQTVCHGNEAVFSFVPVALESLWVVPSQSLCREKKTNLREQVFPAGENQTLAETGFFSLSKFTFERWRREWQAQISERWKSNGETFSIALLAMQHMSASCPSPAPKDSYQLLLTFPFTHSVVKNSLILSSKPGVLF